MRSDREKSVALGLLWLAGVSLRLTVLAVPPVILLIQADLGLSGTEVGILSGLPVILFAAAALPGSLLIARIGALPALVAGLILAGAASGLRGAAASALGLYAATIVMSAGIAVMQTALPPLVQDWLPRRVSFATAVFTNGLLVGEILPVMLTIPVILPLAHASWRGALAIWSIPFFVIAAITLVLAPKADEPVRAARAPVRWWPDWRNKQTWQLGFLLGSVNSVYFCTNAFLPGHLAHAGRSDLVVGALTALNLGQLPASIALLALSRRIERTPWPFVACGGLMLVCIAGIVATASAWTYLFAGVLGFVGAAVLTLALALPPLLNAPRDVARLTAAMFTISYCEGLVISVLSGAAWDVAGDPRFAFLPIAISAIPLLFIPGMIRLERRVTS